MIMIVTIQGTVTKIKLNFNMRVQLKFNVSSVQLKFNMSRVKLKFNIKLKMLFNKKKPMNMMSMHIQLYP